MAWHEVQEQPLYSLTSLLPEPLLVQPPVGGRVLECGVSFRIIPGGLARFVPRRGVRPGGEQSRHDVGCLAEPRPQGAGASIRRAHRASSLSPQHFTRVVTRAGDSPLRRVVQGRAPVLVARVGVFSLEAAGEVRQSRALEEGGRVPLLARNPHPLALGMLPFWPVPV